MTKTRDSPLPQDTDQLTDAVKRLTDEIHLLREAIDEFRGIFRWAVRNDKLAPVAEPETSAVPADDLHEAVLEAVHGLRDELTKSVQDSLRGQVDDLQDALHAFSLDVQWVVRQIRAPAAVTPTAQEPPSEQPPAPARSGGQQATFWT